MGQHLTPEDLALIRPAGPGNWRSDGTQVVFRWAERSGTSCLWTCDVSSGKLQRLTDVPVLSEMNDGTDRRDVGAGPQCSPVDARVAFLSQASAGAGTSIWSVSADGAEACELTRHVSTDRTPRWSSDGEHIAFVGNRDGRDDIQIVSSSGGVALQLTYDRWDNTDLSWSPDDQSIVFCSQRSDVDLFSNNLCVVSSTGSDVIQVTAGDDANDRSPRWSPDGRRIVFISNRADTDDIWSVAPDGSDLQRLTSGPGEKADPQWSPDGKSIVYTIANHCGIDLMLIPSSGGVPRLLVTGGDNQAPRWSPDGTYLLYLRSGPRHPGDLWLKPIEDHSTDPGRCLTDVAQGRLEEMDLVEPEVITYRSRDGLEIEGLLYCPSHQPAHPGPGIVWVHGGSNALMSNGWQPLIQYLVQRGYTILAPNYRGSTGYGKAFMEANMGSETGADLLDWIAAGDVLREREDIDPSRVAIMGASWGGYATLLTLGKEPTAFAAGVAIAAPSNWMTYWEQTRLSWTRRFRIKLMGPPAINLGLYRTQSAELTASNYQSPVLILHGEDDPGVPCSQATGMAAALSAAGKHHEIKTYSGEGHGFNGADAIIDSTLRIERFLATHLAGDSSTS